MSTKVAMANVICLQLEEKKVASRTPAVPSSQGKLGRVEKLTNIVEICAGAQHGLARDDQGRVRSTGSPINMYHTSIEHT